MVGAIGLCDWLIGFFTFEVDNGRYQLVWIKFVGLPNQPILACLPHQRFEMGQMGSQSTRKVNRGSRVNSEGYWLEENSGSDYLIKGLIK